MGYQLSETSQLQDIHIVAQTFSPVHQVMVASSTASLQLDQQQFLQVSEHPLLLHAGHVSLSYSLALGC